MGIDEQTMQEFKRGLRGALIRPNDEAYDAARALYNGMIDKHPEMILRCAGCADVIAAVNFARIHGLPLAIRGGGHSVAGTSMCDGGFVVDLSSMRSVRVDPVHRTVRAEGGATWGDLDHETQAFGLATTGGIVSSTGIAGLTLGGGIGYLNRKYGLACDNLLAADVVTADGRLITANASQNEDLFWALRGGGGNFGVVTSFEYRLYPVGPVLAGTLAWPLAQASEVLRFYRELSISAPDELRLDAILGSSPVGPTLAIVACWCGDLAEGERVIRPLRELRTPVLDTVTPVPYVVVQRLLESLGYTHGMFHYWKSGFVRELSDDAIDALLDAFLPMPSPLAVATIEHLGGAVSRVGESDTAFSHRHAHHSFLAAAIWTDAAAAEGSVAWARHLADVMRPNMDDGVYANYLGEDESDARVRAAYGVNYDRLAAIKAKYDPVNLFRHNQNIAPLPR